MAHSERTRLLIEENAARMEVLRREHAELRAENQLNGIYDERPTPSQPSVIYKKYTGPQPPVRRSEPPEPSLTSTVDNLETLLIGLADEFGSALGKLERETRQAQQALREEVAELRKMKSHA